VDRRFRLSNPFITHLSDRQGFGAISLIWCNDRMISPDRPTRDRPSRRRVVMLVGNFIDGDSRVQKQARSAAAAGWEVFLVGRSPGGEREEYSLGGATVIRAADDMAATRYRASHPRRSGVSGLIAYSSRELSRVRHQRQRLRRFDLAVQRELVERARCQDDAISALFARARLAMRSTFVRVSGYWIAARKQALDRNLHLSGAEPNGARRIGRAKRSGTVGSWDAQPRLVDFEESFGPLLDELRPDLIHANDADTLGVAVRAALRHRDGGAEVAVVYDAHEYFAGEIRRGDASWSVVIAAQELRYLPFVQGVVVATEGLARALVDRYQLTTRPTVVANMPVALGGAGAATAPDVHGVRGDLKLDPDVPLLVHAGAVTPLRGLDIIVRALPELAGVHLALLVGSREGHAADLRALAESLGCGARFHLLDYVAADRLTGYLESATVGVEPLLHTPNHELAVTTKYWSYLQARLPVLVSDVEDMADLTREIGNGEVFVAGDVDSAVSALRRLLGDTARYASAYRDEALHRFTWDGQAEALLELYAEVTGLAETSHVSPEVVVPESRRPAASAVAVGRERLR
jgi:glycosyltransferase involved in cell wall biosynthesis